jgi:hypothetical protein
MQPLNGKCKFVLRRASCGDERVDWDEVSQCSSGGAKRSSRPSVGFDILPPESVPVHFAG